MAANARKRTSFFFPSPGQALIWVLLILGGYGAARAARHLMYRTAVFTVQRVEVRGANYVGEEAVRSAAHIPLDKPMFAINLPEVTGRLLENRYIRGVSISRELPSTVTINIQEREPLLYIVDKTIYMVDANGVVLKKLVPMPMGKVPIVTGLSLATLQKDSTALRNVIRLVEQIKEVDAELLPLVSEINLDGHGVPELLLIRGAARVTLGSSNRYQRLYMLSQFLSNEPVVSNLEKIRRIDLTFENRIIVQHKS